MKKEIDRFEHFYKFYGELTRETLAKFLGITFLDTYRWFPASKYKIKTGRKKA